MQLFVLAPQVSTWALIGGLTIAKIIKGLNLDNRFPSLVVAFPLLLAVPQAARLTTVATANTAENIAFDLFILSPSASLRSIRKASSLPFIFGTVSKNSSKIAHPTKNNKSMPD
ncbi:hypothetical protein [Bifidobacterium breve]|uniref:hypothetical protein n=1 Tax=Bifidobacterium breve TaxID=1685 RepID=UPI001F2193EE|nr:hypothetical protein [Bifidobacterium breve]